MLCGAQYQLAVRLAAMEAVLEEILQKEIPLMRAAQIAQMRANLPGERLQELTELSGLLVQAKETLRRSQHVLVNIGDPNYVRPDV